MRINLRHLKRHVPEQRRAESVRDRLLREAVLRAGDTLCMIHVYWDLIYKKMGTFHFGRVFD